MVSAVQDELIGFGLKVSAEVLKAVNAQRKDEISKVTGKEKVELTTSPGVRFLSIGKNRDGWWGLPMLQEQMEDCMDVYRQLFPDYQVVGFFDQSVEHSKSGDTGLLAGRGNASWGGKGRAFRDTALVDGCIGPYPALMWKSQDGTWAVGTPPADADVAEVRDLKLKVGETQSSTAKDDDPPPFYDVLQGRQVPKQDRAMTDAEKRKEDKRCATNRKAALRNKRKKSGNQLAELTAAQEARYTGDYPVVPGYVGKAKGLRWMAFERGWWPPRGLNATQLEALFNGPRSCSPWHAPPYLPHPPLWICLVRAQASQTSCTRPRPWPSSSWRGATASSSA